MRSEQQKYWDAAAILSLFDCTNKVSDISGNLKLQKLVFIYELRGQKNNLKSAHYKFFRFTLGPFSKDLANDVNFLKELGFITRKTNQLTDRGQFLLEYLSPYLGANRFANTSLRVLKNVCREYGRFSGQQLRDRVYKMVVPVIDRGNKPMKVQDIGIFTDILDPIRDDKLREIDPFPEDILSDVKEEFAIPASELDPENPSVRRFVMHRLQSIA